MKTIITCAAALLVISLAACKKDTTVTRRQEVSTNNKVNKTPYKAPAKTPNTPVADTVIVSDHEIIGKNIRWIFPWYNALELKKIHSYISEETPIKVFVQRDNNSLWIEATPVLQDSILSKYEYFIEKRPEGAGMYNYGSLYIFYYGMDTEDTPDVKVQF